MSNKIRSSREDVRMASSTDIDGNIVTTADARLRSGLLHVQYNETEQGETAFATLDVDRDGRPDYSIDQTQAPQLVTLAKNVISLNLQVKDFRQIADFVQDPTHRSLPRGSGARHH